MGTFNEYIGYNEKAAQILQKLPMFEGLDKTGIRALLDLAKLIRYSDAEIIVKENRFDATIYFLLEGKVAIIKNRNEIAVLSKVGDFFGEMSLIEDMPRSATVMAKTDCTIMSIDSSVLDNLEKKGLDRVSIRFYKKISEKLSKTLREMIRENIVLKERIKQLESLTERRNYR